MHTRVPGGRAYPTIQYLGFLLRPGKEHENKVSKILKKTRLEVILLSIGDE